MAANTTYSIGPGELAQPGTAGGAGIALAVPSWAAIQQYVVDGNALPDTEALFRNQLGKGAPTDLSDFTQLIAAYAQIVTHCGTWAGTYQAVVGLADKIYQYGLNKAPIYYPPILAQAKILETEPDNAQAQQELKSILNLLEKEAAGYATEAASVSSQVQEFANNTAADQVTLVGPDGSAGLLKQYTEKYSSTSKIVEEINNKTTAARTLLSEKDADYRHDVIVASTTPTYAWIWPFGTVAGAVVAGVYGKRATEVLREERVIETEITGLEGEKAADANLMLAIGMATKGIQSINTALSAALPAILQVKDSWNAISSDVKAIADLIETNIREVPPIIMGLGVASAITSWENLAHAADTFRIHADIVEEPPGAEVWKLKTLVAPEAIAALAA